jgi:hypothetical protein
MTDAGAELNFTAAAKSSLATNIIRCKVKIQKLELRAEPEIGVDGNSPFAPVEKRGPRCVSSNSPPR